MNNDRSFDVDNADHMSTDEELMYVLSNSIKVNGASALLDAKMMEEIIEKVGDAS